MDCPVLKRSQTEVTAGMVKPPDLVVEIPGIFKDALDHPVTLAIGDLAVWRPTPAEWRGCVASGQATHLDLLTQPAVTRLRAGTRLLLRAAGEPFLDGLQTIRLTVGPGSSQTVILGQDLVQTLGMMPQRRSGTPDPAGPQPAAADGVKIVAYYLPQFYPFDVNDAAWGDGFTEWSNVIGATPQFPGHKAQILPAGLGFYDLRQTELRRRQAALAAEFGVDAFCYHYYWFSGRRLMQDGLEAILSSGQPSQDFCLCWANEPWSRQWDGSQSEMLVDQDHDPAIDASLIQDLLPYFADERYLKVAGAPMLVIYRLGIMREPEHVIEAWRAAAIEAGLPGLFVVAARTFGLTDAQAAMVDAIVEFPPHGLVARPIQAQLGAPSSFEGNVYDYREAAVNAVVAEPSSDHVCFPGVMPRWDNTARRASKAHIFHDSSPASFQLWTALALARAAMLPRGQRFLFINAWNEWGEGAMLEPDRLDGHAYLEAVRDARSAILTDPAAEQRFRLLSGLKDADATRLVDSMDASVQMVEALVRRSHARPSARSRPSVPAFMAAALNSAVTGFGCIDEPSPDPGAPSVLVTPGQSVAIRGWAVMARTMSHRNDRVAYLVLTHAATGAFARCIAILNWWQRTDVRDAERLSAPDDACYFGFDVKMPFECIDPGDYEFNIVQSAEGSPLRVRFAFCISVGAA